MAKKNQTMKALVKAKRERGLWMEQVPVPEIGPTDVLIKIKTSAICGTDIHIFKWDAWAQKTIPTPMVVGHEYVGEIVAVGSNVKGYQIGDRVSGEGHVVCGLCRNCRAGKRHLCRNTYGIGVNRAGAFGEYLSLPADNVFKIPDGIPDKIASIFDPLGNAVHTALSFDVVGEDVLITGAGPIGLMAIPICRHAGARHIVITDMNDYRLGLAEKMGATRAVNVTQTNLQDVRQELAIHEGFDVGLEMSGSPYGFRDMLQHMNHGGKIALLGILPNGAGIDWDDVIFKSLVIKGIYGREMYETWYKMASMLQSGLNIEPVITHEFGIDDFDEAFHLMESGQSAKVLMHW